MDLRVFSVFCFLLTAVASGLCPRVIAQVAEPEEELIRVDTQLILVPFNVVDRTGKPLRNVKKADISLFENGQKQQIEEFMSVAAPFEVVLLLDTSGSARSELDLIRKSANAFIGSLREGDRVAIIGFRSEIKAGRNTAAGHLLTPLPRTGRSCSLP